MTLWTATLRWTATLHHFESLALQHYFEVSCSAFHCSSVCGDGTASLQNNCIPAEAI